MNTQIIGKKILRIVSVKKGEPPEFILFNDKKTIMEFTEQDQYDYHDCCSQARIINIREDAKLWENLNKLEDSTLDF